MTKVFQSSKQVKQKLQEKIKDYTENFNVYPIINKKTEKAIQNAKKLEKFHLQDEKTLYSDESNPYTSVYKIIEEIQKRECND